MKLKLKKRAETVFLVLWGGILFTIAYAYGGEEISLPKATFHRANLNLKHFNYLFSPEVVDNRKMAIVHIYSAYPDYKYVTAVGEGFACVDDAARAIVMLANLWKSRHDPEVLSKIRKLVGFILYMQNDNGYFNNFVWPDMSINTSYKTSVAEMNWWSFRALWSLEVAYKLVRPDGRLATKIERAIDKVVVRIKQDIPLTNFKTEVVNTIEVPDWLPNKSAADQAALAIIALLPEYKRREDPRVLKIITALARGIMSMQKGDANNYPYGMFLSWKNKWHAWGNSQAYALLLAGQQLKHPEYIKSALREIDNFYPYIMKNGFAESLSIRRKAGHYFRSAGKKFPQIAYGIRPMVYAVAEAYRITGNKKYTAQLSRLKSWFLGGNIVGKPMYDQNSGRTYDAILSATGINMNSGAESTIEGLLVMQK